MSDPADKGNEAADQFLSRALEAAQLKRPQTSATGYCLNCDEPLADGLRWCDRHCRDDWQAQNPTS